MMYVLDLGDDGALADPRWTDGPRDRTWLEFLTKKHDFAHLSLCERQELLEEWGIAEAELSKDMPWDQLLDLYLEETPNGSVYTSLEPLRSDPKIEKIFEFIEGPNPGSDYRGVKVKGSFCEANALLAEFKLPFRIAENLLWDNLRQLVETTCSEKILENAQQNHERPEHYAGLPAVEAELVKRTPDELRLVCTAEKSDDSLKGRLAHALLFEGEAEVVEENDTGAKLIKPKTDAEFHKFIGMGGLGLTGRMAAKIARIEKARRELAKEQARVPRDFGRRKDPGSAKS